VDGQINDATPRHFTLNPLGIQIAGQNADILYIGPAPGQVAGITQVNSRIPQLAPGSYTAYLGWGPPISTQPWGASVFGGRTLSS
jgi:uncharacterized protein (TIGR03437 family)